LAHCNCNQTFIKPLRLILPVELGDILQLRAFILVAFVGVVIIVCICLRAFVCALLLQAPLKGNQYYRYLRFSCTFVHQRPTAGMVQHL